MRVPQDHDLGRAIAPLVDRLEACRRHDVLVVRQLDGDDGARRQPAGLGEGGERRRCLARAIGRIEEDEVAADRAPGGGRVASARTTLAARRLAQLAHVLADQRDRRRHRCRGRWRARRRATAPRARARPSRRRRRARGRRSAARCRRSRQLACTRMLNSASRARLAVGRVASPSGAAMARPRCLPPTIFSISAAASWRATVGCGLAQPVLRGGRLTPSRLSSACAGISSTVPRSSSPRWNGPKAIADQAHHRQVEMGQHAAHLAVLAFGQRDRRARRWSAAGGRAWPGWRRSARPRW